MVDLTYVFNLRSTLNDRSAVALVTGIVNMMLKTASTEGYSTVLVLVFAISLSSILSGKDF